MKKKYMKPCRYFVELSYCGTKYCGWQIQRNAISVQQVLNDAFSKFFGRKIEFVGAGRTDTGVHAINYVAHFEIDKHINSEQTDHILYKINAILPKDISVHAIYPVLETSHARFSAVYRTYQYFIACQKEVFLPNQMYYYSKSLNINEMNKACEYLLGTKDFTSFSKLHSDVNNNICTVLKAEWEEIEYKSSAKYLQNGNLESLHLYNNQRFYKFTIVANRYLRNMVRAIVGTSLDVGKGKITVDQFIRIVDSLDRSQASSSAAAHGLYLVNIEYPDNIRL